MFSGGVCFLGAAAWFFPFIVVSALALPFYLFLINKQRFTGNTINNNNNKRFTGNTIHIKLLITRNTLHIPPDPERNARPARPRDLSRHFARAVRNMMAFPETSLQDKRWYQ